MGQLVVLPGLESQHGLIDANLLTRAVAPVHLRCVELALVSSVLLVGLTPQWLRSRLAMTLALLAVGSTGVLRMVALPSVYDAWARVDRIAQAPYDRMVRAEGLAEEAYWLGLGSIAVLVLMAVLVGVHWIRPMPKPSRKEEPTLSDEATTTHDDAIPDAA
ncbi:MAG: hypothetical protein AAF799_22945 [Myxococcota bacterium]